MLYLDTSLLVSAFTRETRSHDARQWLQQQVSKEVSLSEWVITEFSSALSLKVRTGEIDTAHRGAILAQFTQLAVNSFVVLPVEASAFRTAARFCDQPQLNLRAGDALHLAICAESGATICTLDQKLGKAAPLVGVASVLL